MQDVFSAQYPEYRVVRYPKAGETNPSLQLKVWSSKENYPQLVGRRQVDRDPAPHWRHLVWTTDTALLILASSSGVVEVCDTLAAHVYTVISPRIPASQPGWQDNNLRTGSLRTSYAGVFCTEVGDFILL